MSYTDFAVGLAKQAGAVIKKNFSANMKKEWKEDNSPVTATDKEINTLVIAAVQESYPGHSVLAEEECALTDSEFVWVCDPVDGTVPFSHGMPTCVFSLALVHNGEPIVGVIYDPFMDRMLVALKGVGATLNGETIRVSAATSLPKTMVSAYSYKQFIDGTAVVQELEERNVFVVNPWSITYIGMLVACGEATATIFQGTKSHDTAAMKVIIEEAGGKVTDLFGNEQRYDCDIKGHIASNGILHDELVQLVRKHLL